MLGLNKQKNKEIEDLELDGDNKEKIEQLEAKEIEIEEEIEEIKEEPKVEPKVEEKEIAPEDFEDEDDNEDYSVSEYDIPKDEKSKEKESVEEVKEEINTENPQNQLNRFLMELDARVSKIESILFRLTQNGKQ